jgi:hypothetical protein
MCTKGIRISCAFAVSLIILMMVSIASSKNEINQVNAQVSIFSLQFIPEKSDTTNFLFSPDDNGYKGDNSTCIMCDMSKSKYVSANAKDSTESNLTSPDQSLPNNNDENQSGKFKKFDNFTQIKHGTRLGFDTNTSNVIRNQTSIRNNVSTSNSTNEFTP